ncbi:MAG: hypothetical protein WC688_06175 [Parachlamydiales bacterium]
MTLYKAITGTHDLLFGSSDLRNREYDQFLKEAKTIGDSLRYPGSKISWSPGKTPSYDLPYNVSLGVFSLSLQGVIRKIKDNSPGFIANAVKCSENALEWAEVLKNKFVLVSDDDKRYFELAQIAFVEQSKLYSEEYDKSKELVDKEACDNYKVAARILGQFTYKKEVENELEDLTKSQASLSPGELRIYTVLKRKVLQNQPWFQALEGAATKEDSKPTIADNERSLLLLVPPQPSLRFSESDPANVSVPSSSSSFEGDPDAQDLFNYKK